MPIVIAYLDLTTGSLLAQLLLGGTAGALVLLKLFGARIRAAASEWLARLHTKR